MGLIDVDALVLKAQAGTSEKKCPLAMLAIVARSDPKPSQPSQPSHETPPERGQNLANLADLAKGHPFSEPPGLVDPTESKPSQLANLARGQSFADVLEARRLLDVLVRVEGWAASDVQDGLEAIGRNPADAADLFGEMLGRHDIDSRVRCLDCRHYRQGQCLEHFRAGLDSTVVGFELASLPQNCATFEHGPVPVAAPKQGKTKADIEQDRAAGWFERHRQALEANGWTREEVLHPGSNRARTDAGAAYIFSGFDLVGVEITPHGIVGVSRNGRMVFVRASRPANA